MTDLSEVYARRFSHAEVMEKAAVWSEIVRYLQRYIRSDAPVLDIACDRGDFIRNVVADERWGTDLRDVSEHLPAPIRFVQSNGLELLDHLPAHHFGTIFMSNYLEHLPSGDAVIEQLRVARELLRPDGTLLVLQPNLRLVGAAYWDFIDHKVALTDRSLVEAAELAGLRKRKLVNRFLPYTTKSVIPRHPLLVRAYLAFPPMWTLIGQQSLYIGERV